MKVGDNACGSGLEKKKYEKENGILLLLKHDSFVLFFFLHVLKNLDRTKNNIIKSIKNRNAKY